MINFNWFYIFFYLCSIFFILFSVSIDYQVLIPNGYVIILNLLLVRYRLFDIFSVFIISLLYDLMLNNILACSFIKTLFLIYIHNYLIGFFQKNELHVRWFILNILIAVFIYPSYNFYNYINFWGFWGLLFNFIITYSIASYCFYFYTENCSAARIGFYRIRILCQNQD
jgi:hypothetical protein